MTLNHRYVDVAGTSIHYVESGTVSDAPTLIFLHGFPEFWQTWHAQLSHFSKTHRVIAPDLPGYNLSDKPTNIDFYHPQNLIRVMAEFIELVAPNQRICLIAHDWGGAIAWPLAAFNPQLVDQLVILNAAHPSTFTREMIHNQQQREKSGYIHQLISDGAPTQLTTNNFAYLRQLLCNDVGESVLNQQQIDDYIAAWSQPGAIEGMLGYYRAMPQLAPPVTENADKLSDSVTNTSDMKIPHIVIKQRCLILWGEQDKAFVNEVLYGLEHYVPQLTIKRFSEASHWLQCEQSPLINRYIAQFIR